MSRMTMLRQGCVVDGGVEQKGKRTHEHGHQCDDGEGGSDGSIRGLNSNGKIQ